MSLEALETRMTTLELKHRNLDDSVHSFVKAVAEIKSIVLENRERLDQHDRKLDQLDRKVDALAEGQSNLARGLAALTEATLAGFKRADERTDQLEMLIRQLIPNSSN